MSKQTTSTLGLDATFRERRMKHKRTKKKKEGGKERGRETRATMLFETPQSEAAAKTGKRGEKGELTEG